MTPHQSMGPWLAATDVPRSAIVRLAPLLKAIHSAVRP